MWHTNRATVCQSFSTFFRYIKTQQLASVVQSDVASEWWSGGRGFDPLWVLNILSWQFIMNYFLQSFSPFRWFKKGSCQFLAKECAQYWLTIRGLNLHRKKCGYVNWPCSIWPQWVDWVVKPQHKQNWLTA